MATFAARCASLLGRTCTKNEAHGGAGYVALLGDFGEIFVFFRKIFDFEPTKRSRTGAGHLPRTGAECSPEGGGRIHSTLDNR